MGSDTIVADRDNHKIRIINPSRTVRFYAGVGDPADGGGYKEKEAARFNSPSGVARNWKNQVVVADTGNNRIRVINSSGITSTVAGGSKPDYVDGKQKAARFNGPVGICCDRKGNIFVCDTGNHCIRMINQHGMVGLLAGHIEAGDVDGKGSSARFNSPSAIAIDDQAGLLFVCDTGNNKIKSVHHHHITTSPLFPSLCVVLCCVVLCCVVLFCVVLCCVVLCRSLSSADVHALILGRAITGIPAFIPKWDKNTAPPS